uniref:C2H2-type domain-containing protein n=1 Tax=Ixodes ricinus TaxID=34613 RepID=A0A147BDQ0_IXORI
MDVFICGVCHTGFHDIGKFVEHKNSLGSHGCGQCSAVFHTAEELDDHTLDNHPRNVDQSAPAEEGQAADDRGVAELELRMEGMESVSLVPACTTDSQELISVSDGRSIVTLTAADPSPGCTQEPDPRTQPIIITDGFSFETTENSVVNDIYACSLCQCFALSEDEMLNHVGDCHDRTVAKGSEEAFSAYYRLQQLAPAALAVEDRKFLKAVPAEGTGEDQTTGGAQPTTLHLVVESSGPLAPPRRKRGRPRKTEQLARPQPSPAAKKADSSPLVPARGEDGLYHCPRCKRRFCKERHILGHRCMARGDYVDNLDKKEVPEEGTPVAGEGVADPGDGEVDTDTTEDFKVHRTGEREPWSRGRHRRGRGAGRGARRAAQGQPPPTGEANKENVARESLEEEPAGAEPPGGTERKLHWREDPRHVPVFSRDEDRLAFEEHLNKVDLSCVDHLYTQHQVAQEITCLPGARLAPKEVCDLHVFSCNVCKKVFKTQSHMRLHCLIHTDLKPFTCHQCDFSTNAKGNLYTHMRKHTGNYFKCSRCAFRSCNRSHMAEHEATHSSVRQRCQLCSNDYNTTKSLVNHVRKYHTGPAGRRYLATFQNKQLQNMAVLHICHICNRKFKKKVDRDRHLFVHNVPEPPTAHQCGLCGYQASRRVYLENHYRKHRLVYVCVVCCCLHLSATALRTHLQKEHVEKGAAQAAPEEAAYGAQSDNGMECFVAKNPRTGGAAEDPAAAKDVGAPLEDVMSAVAQILHANPNEDDGSPPTETGEPAAELTGEPTAEPTPEPTVEPAGESAVEQAMEQAGEPAGEVATAVPWDATLESLFAESIRNSWYLPEPDGSLSGGNYVNIPQELTERVPETSSPLAGDKMPGGLAQALEQAGLASRNAAGGLWSLSLLQYKQLTEDVYAKIRETFGSEECPDCGRLFHSRLDLEPHRLTHTDDKPFKCPSCAYSSGSKDNLKRHQETAHEGRTFPCDQCDFVAQSRSSLFQHRQKHAAVGVQGRCPACQGQFPSWRMLRQHLLSEHGDLDRQELFKAMGGQPRVMGRMGRRTYKCPYCGRVFHRSSTDLQKHMWIHEGVKPFQCPDCPYQCRSRNNLNVHRLTHSNDKPHLCDQCGKGYKSKAALRLHTRTHGRGVLYPCNKCEYTATQKCHLKRHLETHDIIRRYVCGHCSYSSNTVNYMKVHYSRKHRGEVFNQNTVMADPSFIERQRDRVYKCLSCSYIFGNMNDMKRHLRLKHGVCLENLSVEEVSGDVLAMETATMGAQEETALDAEADRVELVQEATILSPGSLQGLGEEEDGAAVSLIQQMMEQGALDAGQPVSLVAVEDTILVRDAQGLVLGGPGQASYVIHYVSAGDDELVEQEVEVAP